jgi:hypothetical protein
MAGNGHWRPRYADRPIQQVCLRAHIAGNGPNAIFQFRFDENTGHLTPNAGAHLPPEAGAERTL